MDIYILFWVKPFLLTHPLCSLLKYENVRQNTFQNENEKQNIWDKLFSCNLLVNKKFIP